jgi:hypothetical protein
MRKKSLRVALIVVVLLAFGAPAFPGQGPGTHGYGPIVILGHPWGEYQRTTQTPPCYRPGPTGSSSSSFFPAPWVTDFVVEFYLRYVVKRQTEGQSFIRQHGGAD